MKIKHIKSKVVAIALISGIFAYTSINNVSAETVVANAPDDWAFEESSIPLHDAILSKYGTIDTNTDGYISISEANAYVGAISLQGVGEIGGEIKGINNFTSINSLTLIENGFVGTIPNEIENMTQLTSLSLAANKFTGELPIGISKLTNLTYLKLNTNKFSGAIPIEYGNLIKLTYLDLGNNELEGNLPTEFSNLLNLEILSVAPNRNLYGNPVEIFKNHTKLRILNIRFTNLVQAKPIIPSLVTFASDDLATMLLNAEGNDLANNIKQSDIDKAQLSADFWNEPTKSEWQVKIDLAQQILDAKIDVAAIFTDIIKDDVINDITKEELKTIKDQVIVLPNGPLKDSLIADIVLAESILDAKNQIDTIFGGDTDKKTTKPGLTQTDIDNAKESVDLLVGGPLKDKLLADITIIENIFKNDVNKDGLPDLNIDIDEDGIPDLNVTDVDGNPIINIVTDGEGALKLPVLTTDKPNLNVVTDGEGELKNPVNNTDKPDVNIDSNNDLKPDLNNDTNNDLIPDLNVVTDGKGNLKKPVTNLDVSDINIDTDGDGIPNLNIDLDGDLIPDLNIDLDKNGIADTNIDTNSDDKPDVNIDVNGDGKGDVNVDTDGNGEADANLIQDIDKNKPNYVEPGTTNPIYNVDTNNDGKPDYNMAYNALNTTEALAILAKIDVLNTKLYTKDSLAAMDAKIPAVADILNANGITSRVVTIEAHADQASLDIAVADLVKAYNALVLLTNDKTSIAQTGVDAPVMGMVLMISSLGSVIILKRKFN